MADERREARDALARAHGFTDDAELTALTGSLDYARAGIVFAYEIWKQHDGTKAGLLKILEASKKKL